MRTVKDNVHDHITLTQEEMDVIDHPLFQRLRRIGQNALLHYVWPTATHTRFAHSIGTCHTSQMMLNALMQRSESDANRLYPLREAEHGQAVRYHELDQDSRRALTRLTRLTALVHDLGHGPLSHAFESFAPRVEDIEPLLDDPRLDAIRPLAVHITRGKHGRVRHESISCLLFAKLWNDLGGETWISQAVAIVLLGDHAGTDDVSADLKPWLPFVRDIVASAPVDADRMDYLLRDSRSLGVSYGLYEPDRILKSILCVRADGHYRLGWRLSGLRAIEHFMTSRFFMFAQCYTHKTERSIGLMLKAIRDEASLLGLSLIRTDSLDSLASDYADLSDEFFLRQLEQGKTVGADRLVRLTQNLRSRHLWTRLYDFEADEFHLSEQVLAEMEGRHPGERFILDQVPLEAMKDLDQGSFLVRPDRNGKLSLTEKRSWFEASPIMRTLRDEEQSRIRLYVEADERPGGRGGKLREETIALMCELREISPKPE